MSNSQQSQCEARRSPNPQQIHSASPFTTEPPVGELGPRSAGGSATPESCLWHKLGVDLWGLSNGLFFQGPCVARKTPRAPASQAGSAPVPAFPSSGRAGGGEAGTTPRHRSAWGSRVQSSDRGASTWRCSPPHGGCVCAGRAASGSGADDAWGGAERHAAPPGPPRGPFLPLPFSHSGNPTPAISALRAGHPGCLRPATVPPRQGSEQSEATVSSSPPSNSGGVGWGRLLKPAAV